MANTVQYFGRVVKRFPKYALAAAHVKSVNYCTQRSPIQLSSYANRTHHCGELDQTSVGQQVTLCGWLQYQRLDGLFLTLRDAHGTTQITLPKEQNEALQEVVTHLPKETVIEITGEVQSRPEGQENKSMRTGNIEVVASDMKVLNICTNDLPFHIHEFHKVKEPLRLQYRYLDLRNSELQRNLRLRSAITMRMRHFLCDTHGFIDVETPTLFRKTPGGAREFVVPTHTPGKFYTLPQSPQQFKQLLMVGGLDRYMQIARCYRDETAKPDRQPEFTQLDLEMSFTSQEDVKQLIEDLIRFSWPETLPEPEMPFPRMTYGEAIKLYGSDKPDTRFEMQLQDISALVCDVTDPKLFWLAQAATRYPKTSVQAINFTQAAQHLSNKDLSHVNSVCKDVVKGQTHTTWYAVIRIKESGQWQGSLAGLLGEDIQDRLTLHLALQPGDLMLLAAGDHTPTCSLLGRLRVEVADLLERKGYGVRGDGTDMNFLWVEDFPLFLPKADGPGLESAHHPFTAPHPDDVELVYKQPEAARSQHYDLVLNGCEIGGGSIRIHHSALQKYILTQILKEDTSSLQHLLEALDFGCPPHGGIALGLDRFISMLCGAKSIRDVIAFPKSNEGKDLMCQAPAPISRQDQQYYHVHVTTSHVPSEGSTYQQEPQSAATSAPYRPDSVKNPWDHDI